MDFKKITKASSNAYAQSTNELYSPFELNDKFYLYRDIYTSLDNVVALSESQLFGLTPINPNKPMFPKK